MGLSHESCFEKKMIAVFVCLAISTVSFAKDDVTANSPEEDAKEQVRILEQKQKDDEKRMRELTSEVKDLENNILDEQPFRGNKCDCVPEKSVCKRKHYEDMGISAEEIDDLAKDKYRGCTTLYQADTQWDALSNSCKQAMLRCSEVARLEKIKALNKDIRLLKKEMANDKLTLEQARASAKKWCENCPKGGLQGGFAAGGSMGGAGYTYAGGNVYIENRKPGVGDYLLGSLPYLTQALGMGLGFWAQSKALNTYSHNYNAYLSNCAQIGVPCQGPMSGGGGFGMGYGAGGWGGGFGPYGYGYGVGPYSGIGGFGGALLGGMMGGLMGYPGMGVGVGVNVGMGNGMYPGMYPGVGAGAYIGMPGPLTAGWGVPMYPMGTGFNSGLFPYGAYGPGIGAGIGIGAGLGGYPYGMGGYPGIGGGIGMGGYPYGMGGYPGIGGGIGIGGGLGYPMYGGIGAGIPGFPGYGGVGYPGYGGIGGGVGIGYPGYGGIGYPGYGGVGGGIGYPGYGGVGGGIGYPGYGGVGGGIGYPGYGGVGGGIGYPGYGGVGGGIGYPGYGGVGGGIGYPGYGGVGGGIGYPGYGGVGGGIGYPGYGGVGGGIGYPGYGGVGGGWVDPGYGGMGGAGGIYGQNGMYNSAILQQQRSMQYQQDIMIAQQEVYAAQQRLYQSYGNAPMGGGYGYGAGFGGSVGFGIR